MDTMTIVIVAIIIGLFLGVVSGYFGLRFISGKRFASAKIDASKIIEESEDKKRMILLAIMFQMELLIQRLPQFL